MKFFFIIVFFFYQSSMCQSNWIQLNSPGGGNVNYIFKATDSIFLAGIQNGSVYRTSDYAKTWHKVINGSNTYANNELFVGIFDVGILRSTDFGQTWIQTNCGGGESIVNTETGFMFSFDNVLVNWRLGKSLDSGKTWIALSNGPWHISSLAAFENTIYLGIYDGEYITCSRDSGNTWNYYGSSLSGAKELTQCLFLVMMRSWQEQTMEYIIHLTME